MKKIQVEPEYNELMKTYKKKSDIQQWFSTRLKYIKNAKNKWIDAVTDYVARGYTDVIKNYTESLQHGIITRVEFQKMISESIGDLKSIIVDEYNNVQKISLSKTDDLIYQYKYMDIFPINSPSNVSLLKERSERMDILLSTFSENDQENYNSSPSSGVTSSKFPNYKDFHRLISNLSHLTNSITHYSRESMKSLYDATKSVQEKREKETQTIIERIQYLESHIQEMKIGAQEYINTERYAKNQDNYSNRPKFIIKNLERIMFRSRIV